MSIRMLITAFIHLLTFLTYAQRTIGSGELVINEVLFDPNTDGADFIELLNRSPDTLELSFTLCRFRDQRTDLRSSPIVIFEPGAYICLTSDTLALRSQHPNATHMVEMQLPPMNNDEGIILLIDAKNRVLDSIYYHEDFHFSLLNDVEEVSLERIVYDHDDFSRVWHSASGNVHYATPGSMNSQALDTHSDVLIASRSFSPDNDGYNDLLSIQVSEGSGSVLNAIVFNLRGQFIERIINNELTPATGVLHWDGILDDGSKLPIGHYILYLESFDTLGHVIRKKTALSVQGSR